MCLALAVWECRSKRHIQKQGLTVPSELLPLWIAEYATAVSLDGSFQSGERIRITRRCPQQQQQQQLDEERQNNTIGVSVCQK